MNIERVIRADIISELSDRFQKRQTFNVSYRSTQFNYNDIESRRQFCYSCFDLICDMWHHLNGSAMKITSTFFPEDRIVNCTGCNIICLFHN